MELIKGEMIGLKNKIDSNYPDIIWFKQGLFVITGLSESTSTNNHTINITGQDKMCLLNGTVGGSLPSSIDFGINVGYSVFTKPKFKLSIFSGIGLVSCSTNFKYDGKWWCT